MSDEARPREADQLEPRIDGDTLDLQFEGGAVERIGVMASVRPRSLTHARLSNALAGTRQPMLTGSWTAKA